MRAKLQVSLIPAICLVFGCPMTMPPGDPCEGVTCDAGETCVDGSCVPDTPDPCDGVTCDAGEVCVDGTCVPEMTDPCAGVTCDPGQTCVDGQCVGTGGGDPVAGEAYYMDNGCAACHGADASGAFGPSLRDVSSSEIFDKLSGATSHVGGTYAGVTQDDADDLEAWFSSL